MRLRRVKKEEKVMDTGDNLKKNDGGDMQVDSFKKVTRAEWSKMTLKEKKKYLKERRMWKNRNTVFIKDDSDNEQLTDDEKDIQEEDLQFSDVSEDEKEKDERLATEALKSYADKFEPQQHPEDYKLVMRADVVEAELADERRIQIR